jgi:hypothetical protein
MTPLQLITVRNILQKPIARKYFMDDMGNIHITKHNEVLAALAVAEDVDNDVFQSAIDNLVLTAKLVNSDKFEASLAHYRQHKSVLFIDEQKVIDRFLGPIMESIFEKDWKRRPK